MNVPIDEACSAAIAAQGILGLNRSGADLLMEKSTRQEFSARETIFRNNELGDSMLIVCSGRIALRIVGERRDITFASVVGPGDFVGARMVLAENQRHVFDTIALEDTVVRVLRRKDFDDLQQKHPLVIRAVALRVARENDNLSVRLSEAFWGRAEQRVKRCIAGLVEGNRTATSCVIMLTHEDIACMAGVTRPTASLIIEGGERAGVLEVGRGRIDVHDFDLLKKWAET
jgi:CRP/FNR family transcriptional regulator, cyclic AMP receptor protein